MSIPHISAVKMGMSVFEVKDRAELSVALQAELVIIKQLAAQSIRFAVSRNVAMRGRFVVTVPVVRMDTALMELVANTFA